MGAVQTFKVAANQKVATNTYVLQLTGNTEDITAPGQFVNVEVPGFYLRRPLSVCAWKDDSLTLLYKVFGEGSEAMTRMTLGQEVNVLSGLGQGFTVPEEVKAPLIVGGGVGIAPMYALAKHLLEQGLTPQVVLGFGSEDEVALAPQIHALGAKVTITTVDGSRGTKGFVTDGMEALAADGIEWDFVYACGPTPMLKAVYNQAGSPGQYSVEERMACGFGACAGCVIETREGVLRVCKEGPVFGSEVLQW